MRILHTADWHLGKRLEKFSRLEEQREVMEEIIEIADKENADAVIIAGDLFDHYNPASEAVELFYRTLKRLTNGGKRVVLAIAGNHDSPDRIEAPDPLAKECGIIFAGYPHVHISECKLENGICISKSRPGFIELILPGYEYPLRILLTPYANEYRLKTFLGIENPETELRNVLTDFWTSLANEFCDDQGVNVLAAHLFFMKKGEKPPEEPEDEKPILHIGGAQAIYSVNIPPQIQYTALGHIHRYMLVDSSPCPVIYSSSPLAYSFSETGHQKGVVLIDAQPGKKVAYKQVALTKGKKLERKRFESVDAAVTWLTENLDCLVELTIATKNYLTGEERKRIYQAHPGIVTLIPEVSNPTAERQASTIDLSLDLDELFSQYFAHRLGQEPAEEYLSLFREIRAEQNHE